MEPKTNGFDSLPENVARIQDQLNRIEKFLKKLPGVDQNYDDKLMSVDEAAEFVSLAKQTMYGLVSQRKIPFIKRKGTKRVYFSKKDLRDWLLAGRRGVRINK